MVNYKLNRVFGALTDPTRRGILAVLAEGPRAVTELARPYPMSLPGFMKHLRILEDAGLLAREKEGRVVSCTLSADPMREAAAWINRYRGFWEARLDALERYLEKEDHVWPQSRYAPRSPSSAPSKRRRRKSGAH